jgi:hypothetical protein
MEHIGTVKTTPDPSATKKNGGQLHIQKHSNGSILLLSEPENISIQLTKTEAQELISILQRATK